jgi:hypothetical protein
MALALLPLAGCGTISQDVKPIALSASEPREICVVEDTAVRAEFRDAYKDALSGKGFTVRVLPNGSPVSSCPLTTTYLASWQWDLELYVSYIDLKVYRNDRLEGEAVYDAKEAAANTNKFVNARGKVEELTNQLFPK